MRYNKAMRRGLTLIEIMIAVLLIVLLTFVYFIVANPAGQLAGSRNKTRKLDLETLMVAIRQNVADQGNETFSCAAGPIPTSTTNMGSAAGSYNIAPCLVPIYLLALPFDPSASSAYYNSVSDYNTGYSISGNTSGTITTITLSAPHAELNQTVSITQ